MDDAFGEIYHVSFGIGESSWPTLGAKGDLKLLAEEQVLDDQVPRAADGCDNGGLN